MWGWILGIVALAVLTVAGRLYRLAGANFARAAELNHGSATVLEKAAALRDEVTLIGVENERLRRQGVWYDEDHGAWIGRIAIGIEAESKSEAYVKLRLALGATVQAWPSTTVGGPLN